MTVIDFARLHDFQDVVIIEIEHSADLGIGQDAIDAQREQSGDGYSQHLADLVGLEPAFDWLAGIFFYGLFNFCDQVVLKLVKVFNGD